MAKTNKVRNYILNGLYVADATKKDLSKPGVDSFLRTLDRLTDLQIGAHVAAEQLEDFEEKHKDLKKEAGQLRKQAKTDGKKIVDLTGKHSHEKGQREVYENQTVPQYNAEVTHLRGQETALQTQVTGLNGNVARLSGDLGTVTGERDATLVENTYLKNCIKYVAGFVAAATLLGGIVLGARGCSGAGAETPKKAETSIDAKVEEPAEPAVPGTETAHKGMYTIETRESGKTYAVISGKSLGREENVEYLIKQENIEMLKTYVEKAEKHAKLPDSRAHYIPTELEQEFKNLAGKTSEGDKYEITKEDLGKALKDMGE